MINSSVSTKQKLKIRLREILELALMVGCGIPVGLSIFESFFVLSPAVLLILGAFTLAAVAHFLMTNTWDENCKGSFCYKNNGKLNFVFTALKLGVVLSILLSALTTIVLGLLQVFNPVISLVLGTVSLTIFFRVALLLWCQSENDKNEENSNDARKDDSELSERNWLEFMTIMYPIACVLLLLSALAGTLPLTNALICCIPFGGIGLFTGICFWYSKHHKPNGELLINENRDIGNIEQNNLDKPVEQVTCGEICDNAPPALTPQNQFDNMNLQQYNIDGSSSLPSREEIVAAKGNQKNTSDKNGAKGNDVNLSPRPDTDTHPQEQKEYYDINKIDD